MDKILSVFGLSKPNPDPKATPSFSTTVNNPVDENASKRKSKTALDLAQAQCNPMSMIGMGYSSPPRSSAQRRPQASSSSTAPTVSEARESSKSPPITVSSSATRSRRSAISSRSPDQVRHPRLHALGRHTSARSRYSSPIPESIPETPDEFSAVPYTPPSNSHTDVVGLFSSVGKRKVGYRSKVLDAVAEIEEKSKN